MGGHGWHELISVFLGLLRLSFGHIVWPFFFYNSTLASHRITVIFERLLRCEDFFIRNLSRTYILPRITLRFDINNTIVVYVYVYVSIY
jgi:hypothetical protein